MAQLPARLLLLIGLSLLLRPSTSALGQSIFDNIPAQCAVALKLDVVSLSTSSSQQLAYLGTIDEETYKELTKKSNGAGGLSFAGFSLDGNASFEEFRKERQTFFEQIGYTYNKADALNLLSQTTSYRAFQSFDSCMESMSKMQPGFQVWRQSEDENDLILACHWTAPPAGEFPGGIVRPITVVVSTEGRGKSTFKLGAGDYCNHIVVPRKGSSSLNVTVSGGGSSYNFASALAAATPMNVASISYLPLQKVDGIETVDQTSLSGPMGNGTMDMHEKADCKSNFPPIACDGNRKHFATAISLEVFPPVDGDLYDPGQSNIITARDVGGDQGARFCDQFSVQYLLLPPPPKNTTGWSPDLIEQRTKLQGKHSVNVIARCWGRPALINVKVASWRMVPSTTAVNGGSIHFSVGESIIFAVDKGAKSKIQFVYGKMQKDLVEAGNATSDGKIVCQKTFDFDGKTFYIYVYKT